MNLDDLINNFELKISHTEQEILNLDASKQQNQVFNYSEEELFCFTRYLPLFKNISSQAK